VESRLVPLAPETDTVVSTAAPPIGCAAGFDPKRQGVTKAWLDDRASLHLSLKTVEATSRRALAR
jgi:hypothetical protein